MHLNFSALLWRKASLKIDTRAIGKRTLMVVVSLLHYIYFLSHVILVTYFIVILLISLFSIHALKC